MMNPKTFRYIFHGLLNQTLNNLAGVHLVTAGVKMIKKTTITKIRNEKQAETHWQVHI